MQVIRIQPNESIYLKINNKVPGLGLNLDVQKLDLSYKTRYNKHLPDAYERLILDVINGDKRLFIRNDELEAAWDLFTPILKVSPSLRYVDIVAFAIKFTMTCLPLGYSCIDGLLMPTIPGTFSRAVTHANAINDPSRALCCNYGTTIARCHCTM